MKPKAFLEAINREAIVAAIEAAERRTSGQIRVLVTHQKPRDILGYGQRAFAKLGMARTLDRNAVLILLAPYSQKLAVIGDIAVHERCGASFWQDVVVVLETGLRHEAFTAGVVEAVNKVGDALAEHFPVRRDSKNELSDEVVEE
jgi:uncharacterized membrane protein